MAPLVPAARDLQCSSREDFCGTQVLYQSEKGDAEMENSRDFDSYSEGLVSSSSFLLSPTSGSRGFTSPSSSVSGSGNLHKAEHTSRSVMYKKLPSIHQFPFPMADDRQGLGYDCIDPRLMTSGSTPSPDLKCSEEGSSTSSGQMICRDTTFRNVCSDPPSSALKYAGHHITNEFDTAFEEMQIAMPNSDAGVRMWLHTWLDTNPDKFPNSEELESLKTLSRLSESEIMAWLSENASSQMDSGAMSSVNVTEKSPRQARALRYRSKCCRSRRCFPYITETQNETRTYECTHRCGQSFDKKGQWTRHERYNVEEWRCRLCGFVNARKDKLLNHLREAHNLSGTPNGSHCRQLLPPGARPCGFCLKQFSNWSAWLNHVGAHFEGHIPGGPWTMARWNRTVDQQYRSEDSGDDDDDNDHDADRKDDDCNDSSADPARESPTGGKGPSHGIGPEQSSNSSDSSKPKPPGSRKARSYKRVSDWLYRGHSGLMNKSGKDGRFKCPVKGCRYREQGLSTEKERDRHVFDKHSATSCDLHCTYCSFKTKLKSNWKQHIEEKHSTQLRRYKDNFEPVSTLGETRRAPDTRYFLSAEIPALESLDASKSENRGLRRLLDGMVRFSIHSAQPRKDAKRFFKCGNVFAVLWDGPAGNGGWRGSSHICRVVVLKERHGFCLRLPLHPYHSQGVGRPRLRKTVRHTRSFFYMTGGGVQKVSSLTDKEASDRAMDLDLPDLISSVTVNSTGGLLVVILSKLVSAQMDPAQPLRLSLSPESNDTFTFPQLNLIDVLADRNRNVHSLASPDHHLKAKSLDLRPAARLGRGGWRRDLKPPKIIIGSTNSKIPPSHGIIQDDSGPYTTYEKYNHLQPWNLSCRLGAFGRICGNANGSLNDSNVMLQAWVPGRPSVAEKGYSGNLPIQRFPAPPKISQQEQPPTTDGRRNPQTMGVQSCCLACLSRKGFSDLCRQREPNAACERCRRHVFKNDIILDRPDDYMQPRLLYRYKDLKADAGSWAREQLEKWDRSWNSLIEGCGKLSSSKTLVDKNLMASNPRSSKNGSGREVYGGCGAFLGAGAWVHREAARGMEHVIHHSTTYVSPLELKDFFPNAELASTQSESFVTLRPACQSNLDTIQAIQGKHDSADRTCFMLECFLNQPTRSSPWNTGLAQMRKVELGKLSASQF